MRSERKHQQGMTTIGFAMILVLVGFFAVMVVKIMPAYLENFKVSSAINGLASDERAKEVSPTEIRELLLKKLSIDDVTAVNKGNIFIEKTSTGKTVSIKYETRIPMFSNIDAVVKYESEVVELR